MEKNALLLSTTHDFLRKFLTEEVALLRERGYSVHYAANFWEPPYLSDEGAIRALGVVPHHVDIARSPYRLGENRRALSQLLELIQGHRVRALLCHTPVGGLLGRLAGRLSPRRPVVVYTAHGFHFYRGAPLAAQLAYYPAEWALARFTDILVTINAEDYRAARQLPLAPGGKVFRLPGVGLDRGAFSPPSPQEREAGRRALGVRPQDTLLLSVGELNGNKNHQVVLRALSRLREVPGGLSGVRYLICGEGFARPQLRREIAARGLEGTVSLEGYRRDIPRLLACADATVFPSRREGLGMAGLESLAMGVPVIAADNRGTREYMRQGVNGLLVPWDDPAAFARAVDLVRRLDAPRRQALSRRCAASVAPFEKGRARQAMGAVYDEMDRKVRRRFGE